MLANVIIISANADDFKKLLKLKDTETGNNTNKPQKLSERP